MINKMDMNPTAFTEDQITRLFIEGIISKEEARELSGLNKPEVTLPFHSVIRLVTVKIIEPSEARTLLGFK